MPMKTLIAAIVLMLLAACGVETATTAATGAVIKKQEIEEGKKTMERTQAKVEDAMQQMQQRAEKDNDANK
jgi:surface antigen